MKSEYLLLGAVVGGFVLYYMYLNRPIYLTPAQQIAQDKANTAGAISGAVNSGVNAAGSVVTGIINKIGNTILGGSGNNTSGVPGDTESSSASSSS